MNKLIGLFLLILLSSCQRANLPNTDLKSTNSALAQESAEKTIRQLVTLYHPNNVYIGATAGHKNWGSPIESILNKEFSYITPKNDFKQTRIHPRPGKWNWKVSDQWIEKAKQNNQIVRLHGPISPQSSKWVKEDHRTSAELEQILIEFMTALSKRYNNEPVVKWMDVVNETIDEQGNWFGPVKGTSEWENPWTILGFETNIPAQFPLLQKKGVPLYIIKAFELSNKYAPNISQVLNQHRMTSPKSIAMVKELVMYLRYRGLKVDGLGWQAHIKSELPAFMSKGSGALKTFDNVIKWAHQNDLDFHVTENNLHYPKYKKQDPAIYLAFVNIVKTLLNNKSTGVVTWNLWNINDQPQFEDKRKLILGLWTDKLQAKPVYDQIKAVLVEE